jgi:predicted DNA-binding transcriptional regulator AlpA
MPPTETATPDAADVQDILIPLERVARSLDLDPSTIAKMEKRGDFIRSIPLGVRKRVYLYSELQDWWRTRLGGQNGQPFPLAPERRRGTSTNGG